MAKLKARLEPGRIRLGRLQVGRLGSLPFLAFLGLGPVVKIGLGHLPIPGLWQGRMQVSIARIRHRGGEHVHDARCVGGSRRDRLGRWNGRQWGTGFPTDLAVGLVLLLSTKPPGRVQAIGPFPFRLFGFLGRGRFDRGFHHGHLGARFRSRFFRGFLRHESLRRLGLRHRQPIRLFQFNHHYLIRLGCHDFRLLHGRVDDDYFSRFPLGFRFFLRQNHFVRGHGDHGFGRGFLHWFCRGDGLDRLGLRFLLSRLLRLGRFHNGHLGRFLLNRFLLGLWFGFRLEILLQPSDEGPDLHLFLVGVRNCIQVGMIRVQRSLVLARRLERDSLVQSGAGILGIHEGGLIKILCGSLVPLLDMGQDTQTI